MSGNRDIVIDLVSALAEVEGVEPHELDYALEAYVDTDALARLAAMDNSDWELTFHLPNHTVTLDGDGGIHVDGTLHQVVPVDSPDSTS